jgi:hypothetical protein
VEKVADVESRIVYRGPELSYLAIMLRVAKSFTGKPKGSNSVEQELSVVKRLTKRRLNKVGGDQDIIEVKWSGKHRVTYGGDR